MNRDSQIISLYRHGKGLKAIAKEIGTNHMAIKRILIKAGVYHNTHGPEVTARGNNGVTSDTPPCKPSPNQTAPQEYQKDLCKNSQSCAVCQLELDSYVQLRELYRLGAPSPVLCSYFNLTAKALAGHAFAKNWHKRRSQLENPERKRILRQMIEDETWKVVMGSNSEGQAKDKLSGLKLLSELEGIIGEKGPSVAVNVGATLNMRFAPYPEQAQGKVVDVEEEESE